MTSKKTPELSALQIRRKKRSTDLVYVLLVRENSVNLARVRKRENGTYVLLDRSPFTRSKEHVEKNYLFVEQLRTRLSPPPIRGKE